MKSGDFINIQEGDALIVVDLQNDFLPGGALAVPDGNQVIPVMNEYMHIFEEKDLPIFATRDWHPPKHSSFRAQGGPWPPHCIQNTEGAEFPTELKLYEDTTIISKATEPKPDAYSGFDRTDLHDRLQNLGVKRLFIGGLATDYCVLNTVKNALSLGYQVYLLKDAIRAVNVQPGDGEKAKEEMVKLGAKPIDLGRVK
jgi:nicotinamidase/pyrazinamidase